MTELWVVRHGETTWSADGRHTSRTDLALTAAGERDARDVRDRLHHVAFDAVLTSPRLRARRTAEIAGFADADVDDDLVEWDYGEYEGVTTDEIRERVPGWSLWTHPTPGGESAAQVAARLDRVIARVRTYPGRVLAFSHGHALRSLAARWLAEPVAGGRHLRLDTATVSVLGDDRGTPVVVRWNA
ncbi:MAG TPA: histidine phosphatase family protein [Nocardioidaceae bacterium]|nr:histidine phosphatase family protein [Nocardioidaceae bacterium]